MHPESPAPGVNWKQPNPTEFRETGPSSASLTQSLDRGADCRGKKWEDDSDGSAHN